MKNIRFLVASLLLGTAFTPAPTWAAIGDATHQQICADAASFKDALEIIAQNYNWIEAQGGPAYAGDGLIGITDLEAAFQAAPQSALSDALSYLLNSPTLLALVPTSTDSPPVRRCLSAEWRCFYHRWSEV